MFRMLARKLILAPTELKNIYVRKYFVDPPEIFFNLVDCVHVLPLFPSPPYSPYFPSPHSPLSTGGRADLGRADLGPTSAISRGSGKFLDGPGPSRHPPQTQISDPRFFAWVGNPLGPGSCRGGRANSGRAGIFPTSQGSGFLGPAGPAGPGRALKNGSEKHEFVMEIGRGGVLGEFSEGKGSYTLN